MLAEYRKVEFTEEMILLLKDYVQNKWPLLLWQTHLRHAAKESVALDFDPKKKVLALALSDNCKHFDFTKPLFCKGEEKKLIFKTDNLSGQNQSLSIIMPDEVRLHELRQDRRYDMFTNKKAFLTVFIDSVFVFKLNDISRSGCSIIMSEGSLKHFREGSQVKITHIGSDECIIAIPGVVKHVRLKSRLYLVGIKFEHRIAYGHYYLTKNLER